MRRRDDPVREAEYKEMQPVGIYDAAVIESWLETRGREGYRLVGFRGHYGHFDREAPSPGVRYRLKPLLKREKAPDQEWVQIYHDLGWEYVTTLGKLYHVWRCDDPSAPELETDPIVQGEGCRYLKRRMLVEALVILMLVLLAAVVLTREEWNSLWETLAIRPALMLLTVCLLYLLALAVEVLDIHAAWIQLRALKTGIPVKRSRRFLWKKRMSQVICGLFAAWMLMRLICIIAWGSVFIGTDPVFAWSACGEDGVPKPGVVYVDLRALDGVPEERVEYITVKTKIHELAPRMYWCTQISEPLAGSQEESYAETAYFRLLVPGLAPVLERDMLEWCGHLGKTETDVKTPMTEQASDVLDSFWLRQAEDGWQTVIAVRGRRVLYLKYSGPTDLRTAEGYLASLLGK